MQTQDSSHFFILSIPKIAMDKKYACKMILSLGGMTEAEKHKFNRTSKAIEGCRKATGRSQDAQSTCKHQFPNPVNKCMSENGSQYIISTFFISPGITQSCECG